MILMIYVF